MKKVLEKLADLFLDCSKISFLSLFIGSLVSPQINKGLGTGGVIAAIMLAAIASALIIQAERIGEGQ